MVSLQNRAFARGTVASLQRAKERTVTVVVIKHMAEFDRSSIMSAVKQALIVRGGMNPAHTSIELDEGGNIAELQAALSKSEHEVQTLRRQMAAMTLIQAEPPATAHRETRWMKPREAAEDVGVSLSSIYRAIEDGRITTKSTKVTRKSNHEVDPKTFKRKQRTKKNEKN